ncbi:MAG: ABC transporter ATP-binding protein [Planctomycetota bacterium]|nr:MAG: ABC transporter ATP-binding protein [Planctomycetota bacterium]
MSQNHDTSATPAPADAQDALLTIDGLRTWFDTEEGLVKAVDGVSYKILPGETLGVVGESGCGKSVTAMSILQLLAVPPARYAGGRIVFKGEDLLQAGEARMRAVRGDEIAMIFQEPMTSLNPVYTVGAQIMEALILHRGMGKAEARTSAIEMLARVGIPSPEQRVDEYPHQMSGGMKQRVMIAMALSCDPSLLIADEPTTALDVTIQAQILDLLRDMQKEYGMSILLITHDLGVVAEMSDHVAVMYASKVVEYADVRTLFKAPRHPYTFGLFQSLPEMHAAGDRRLREIPGTVPNPLNFPSGCKFRTRCFKADQTCAEQEPELRSIAPGHELACHAPVTDAELASEAQRVGRSEATS